MKSISIEYYALLREEAGKDQESLNTDCRTLGELYENLKIKYGLSLPLDMIQVAVNDEFTKRSQEIQDGDKVVFIPPVAGG